MIIIIIIIIYVPRPRCLLNEAKKDLTYSYTRLDIFMSRSKTDLIVCNPTVFHPNAWNSVAKDVASVTAEIRTDDDYLQ